MVCKLYSGGTFVLHSDCEKQLSQSFVLEVLRREGKQQAAVEEKRAREALDAVRCRGETPARSLAVPVTSGQGFSLCASVSVSVKCAEN